MSAEIAPIDTWRYLSDVAVAETIPLGMHVDLTYRCDLACSHCYLEDRRRRELSLEEYREFFAEWAGLGGFYLLVSGGVFFVRPDALEILWAAARQRFDMSLITHAMSIDDEAAAQIHEMGIRRVSVSVYHTDPAIHDRVTLRRGSFERTLAGIQRLRRLGVDVLIKTPVFTVNAGAEAVMPALAESLGANLELSAAMRGGNTGSEKLLSLNMSLDDKANVYDCLFSKIGSLDELPQLAPEERTCLAAHASAYLGPDGTVQPCLDYEQSAGNIRDQSFTELWRTSPLLQRLRDIRRNDFHGCSSCENYGFCGLCPALSHRETGDPTGSAPSRCRESTAIRYAFERREAEQMAQELKLAERFGLTEMWLEV